MEGTQKRGGEKGQLFLLLLCVCCLDVLASSSTPRQKKKRKKFKVSISSDKSHGPEIIRLEKHFQKKKMTKKDGGERERMERLANRRKRVQCISSVPPSSAIRVAARRKTTLRVIPQTHIVTLKDTPVYEKSFYFLDTQTFKREPFDMYFFVGLLPCVAFAVAPQFEGRKISKKDRQVMVEGGLKYQM